MVWMSIESLVWVFDGLVLLNLIGGFGLPGAVRFSTLMGLAVTFFPLFASRLTPVVVMVLAWVRYSMYCRLKDANLLFVCIVWDL